MTLSVLSDHQLELLLSEDVPYGDLTTHALGIERNRGEATFLARAAQVVCGTEEAARLFELAGGSAKLAAISGSYVSAGAELLTVEGPASALLGAWKVAQNLVEWSSGIASSTAHFVARVREVDSAVPVACTRKAFPGTRWLSAKAVLCGGATLHRLGLSESLLVFPEHRVFLEGSVSASVWVSSLRAHERERRLTVEVTSVDEACELARAGAEALQLERFAPGAVRECRAQLAALGLRPLLLAAGGVTEANAAEYVRAGADVLVTSAPYQAKPVEVKVLIRASD